MQAYLNRLNSMTFNILLWQSFLSLSLSIQVLEKTQIFDEYGMTGISSFWGGAKRNSCWFHTYFKLSACLLNENIRGNCTIVSNRYYVNTTEELFIEIKTETRNLTATTKSCENKFVVFATFESNKLDKTRTDNIANIPHNKTLHKVEYFFITTDTISFSKYQEYDYVMVGFNALSYCGTVHSFSMYYYICPESTIELVEFERQVAPIKSVSPKVLPGKCTNFALERRLPLTMKCYFNGSFEIFGNCECRPGFTNVSMKCQGW